MPGMNSSRTLGVAPLVLATLLIISVVSVPGAWAASKYRTLYKFTGGKDGEAPTAGLICDQAGSLYGTTWEGGNSCNGFGCGVVFKLAPQSDGSWTESVLYTFCPTSPCTDGANPSAGLIFDQTGNLYGTTWAGGNS